MDPLIKGELAVAFAGFIRAGDYTAASHIIMRAADAEDSEFIAGLLENVTGAPASVSQKIGTVEAGSTVVGYSARRIGG